MKFLRKGLFFASGTLFGFLFALYSYLVHKDLFKALDFDTTVKLQDRIPRRFDDLFSFFSFIGSFESVLILLLIVLILLRKLRGIIALFLFAGFHVFELFGKVFLTQLPPPEFMIRTERWMNFPQFYVRSENSYPSGHAGRNAFLTVLLVFLILRSKKLSFGIKVLLLSVVAVFDVLMLVSRIYLGEHWLSDVVGGVLLGGALSLLSVSVY